MDENQTIRMTIEFWERKAAHRMTAEQAREAIRSRIAKLGLAADEARALKAAGY